MDDFILLLRCSTSRDGAQPGFDLGRFPGRGRRRRLRPDRLERLLLRHEPALLQQPVDDDAIRGHHVAPGPHRAVFVQHRFGYAQTFERPSGVRLRVGQLALLHATVVGGRRVSAPMAVHRVVVEPTLVRRCLSQPLRLQHLVDAEPVVGRRVEH